MLPIRFHHWNDYKNQQKLQILPFPLPRSVTRLTTVRNRIPSFQRLKSPPHPPRIFIIVLLLYVYRSLAIASGINGELSPLNRHPFILTFCHNKLIGIKNIGREHGQLFDGKYKLLFSINKPKNPTREPTLEESHRHVQHIERTHQNGTKTCGHHPEGTGGTRRYQPNRDPQAGGRWITVVSENHRHRPDLWRRSHLARYRPW